MNRTFVLFALSCFAIFAVALPGDAQCIVSAPRQVVFRGPQIISAPVFHNPVQVVQTQTVATVVTPTVAVATQVIPVAVFAPVAVPTYNVGYAAGMDQYQSNAIVNELKQLRADFQQLLASNGPLALKGALPVPKGATVLTTRCANCHDQTVATAKGKGNVLFKEGKFIDEGDNAGKVIAVIDDDSMPKTGPKLTDREKFDVLKFLTVTEAKK